MAIPGAFPRIAIRTFTLSINHLHIQYGNMAIKTTHSNFFYFFFTSLMTYPDQRHHTASIPITKINIYVAITYEDSTAMSLQSHIP